MLNYVIYNTSTGEITKSLQIYDENDTVSVANNVGGGEASLQEDGEPSTHYVTGGVSTPKLALSTVATWNTTTIDADGVDAATLGSSLPNPTRITVIASAPGIAPITQVNVTTGTFTLTTTTPGTYTVITEVFPYLNTSTTIEAT